jgi:hypothetical protein
VAISVMLSIFLHNLFAVVSVNPEKLHRIEWIIGRENGDSHCFVAFVKHLIPSGWFRHDEVLVMDNAAIHTGGDADIVEDLLWDTVIEGPALNVLAVFLLTRAPELNPIKLVFKILA